MNKTRVTMRIMKQAVYFSFQSVIFDEIELIDCSIAECNNKNFNHNFQVITPFRNLVLCADSRKEMEEWIVALKSAANREFFEHNVDHREMLSGHHNWYACSHARPTYCNVCREALSGVTSHGLSCEVCKLKAHKRCAVRANNNCKWTTLASIGRDIIEDDEGTISMPHQWLEGNLPVSAKCSACDKTCGSVLRLQDWRCLWCKAMVHNSCRDSYRRKCPLGQCRISILPPTAISNLDSDGYWRASKPPGTSPLLVFVNSKSGDNQGVKMLRRFKQLLNPAQVFDLINGGPKIGLRLFQNFVSFRVLVCGGDGSIGWVLAEIDTLGIHKQCQVGVLPLGTGNDLARVLGWGAAFDDDTMLNNVLEQTEHAQISMLDRWSILTYETSLPANVKMAPHDDVITTYENDVMDHLSKILNSDDHNVVITSAKVLCETVKDFVARVAKDAESSHHGSLTDKCDVLNQKLDALLKTLNEESQAQSMTGISERREGCIEEEAESDVTMGDITVGGAIEQEAESGAASSDVTESPLGSPLASPTEKDFVPDTLPSPTKSPVFKPREQLMCRANSLKKAIRRIIEHTEHAVDEQNGMTEDMRRRQEEAKSPCDPPPQTEPPPPSEPPPPPVSPLILIESKDAINMRIKKSSSKEEICAPHLSTEIKVTVEAEDDDEEDDEIKNISILKIEDPSPMSPGTPLSPTLLSPPPPSFSLTPSPEGDTSYTSTPGSLTPLSPGVSPRSSPLPWSSPFGLEPPKSPRTSRQLSAMSMFHKPKSGKHREKSPIPDNISFPLLGPTALSPMPALGGSVAGGLAGGSFISKVLLANADALCAAASPLMEADVDVSDYTERCVMNNYFGIGVDAKISLDFHLKREEHPQKCRSRTKNMMWYGVIGTKEIMTKTFKNLDQRVHLECDGKRIPLPNLQGLVVLNIPSYMGGINFWGNSRTADDNFISTSFDDKILEVVAVFGSAQLGISRVINLHHHRIAQCRSVRIKILGEEGVPVQVDGEAWVQPPGYIRIYHKNRAQMLTRDKVFEEALKQWTEKQKLEKPVTYQKHETLSEEESMILHNFVETTEQLIKSVKVASICHSTVEQELIHLATQASEFLERLYPAGKLAERDQRLAEEYQPAIRTQVSDLVSSVRSLYNETTLFMHEKAPTCRLRPDVEDKLVESLNAMDVQMRKVYEIGGLPHFHTLVEEASQLQRKRKEKSKFKLMSRWMKGGKKEKDVKYTGPSVVRVHEWGTEQVGQWLESLGLAEYKDKFTSHDVQGQELLGLGRQDLKELGVSKVGHMKRIQQGIKYIKERMSDLDKTATVL